MGENRYEIKNGITLHVIKTNKFKTNLMAITFTTKITRENVTKNAMVPMLLRSGSEELESRDIIYKELEDMYGAGFDCGVDKSGDNHVLKFYLECIDDKYLPNNENVLEKGLATLLDIAFDPKTENGAFKKEYIDIEKNKISRIIEGKKDNKSNYAILRCQEEMFEGTPFGLYKYGYIEDIDKIDAKNLYEHYKKIVSECKIDIFVSGDIDEEKIVDLVKSNKNIQKLNERKPEYNKDNMPFKRYDEKEVIEKADVAQGNLIMGLGIDKKNGKREEYISSVYNSILGGTATSKLFQNVREKNSLAYTASSNYLKQKDAFVIRCGIEIENYEKAVKLIKEQIEDMKTRKLY